MPQSPPLGSAAAELRILKAMELTTILGKTPEDHKYFFSVQN